MGISFMSEVVIYLCILIYLEWTAVNTLLHEGLKLLMRIATMKRKVINRRNQTEKWEEQIIKQRPIFYEVEENEFPQHSTSYLLFHTIYLNKGL